MRTPIADFKDLQVWQSAMNLAAQAYELAKRLPATERFGLAFQIRRSAVSVPSNIAEGYGRRSRRDYVRFLGIANASLKELETQILLVERLGMLVRGELEVALCACASTARMMTALIRSLSS